MLSCKHGMPTDWCAICTPRPKPERPKVLKDQDLVIKKRKPRLCSRAACGRKHFGRGFCRKHYDKFRPDNNDRALLYYWRHHEKMKKYMREYMKKRYWEKKGKNELTCKT